MNEFEQQNQENDVVTVPAISPSRVDTLGHRSTSTNRITPMDEGNAVVVSHRNSDQVWEDNSIRPILGMLGRRRAIIFATLLAVFVLTSLFLWLTPPIYEATATMQVHVTDSSKEESSSSDNLVMSASPGGDHGYSCPGG